MTSTGGPGERPVTDDELVDLIERMPDDTGGGHRLLVTLSVAALAFLVGIGAASAFFLLRGDGGLGQPDKIAVSGSVTIEGSSNQGSTGGTASECAGERGYGDLTTGASVRVTNAEGTVVGTGRLGGGDWAYDGSSCTFPFQVPGVAGGSDFYGIEVASRGVVTYSADDVAKGADGVQLSIGS